MHRTLTCFWKSFLELAKCLPTVEHPGPKVCSTSVLDCVQQASLFILLADCSTASEWLGFWEGYIGLFPV
jgi:hypothetical protein